MTAWWSHKLYNSKTLWDSIKFEAIIRFIMIHTKDQFLNVQFSVIPTSKSKMAAILGQLRKLTYLIRFRPPLPAHEDNEHWGECAVLARNPLKTLGAFHAQERTLQSCLTLPSPFENLQIFTHSTETAKSSIKPSKSPKKKNSQRKTDNSSNSIPFPTKQKF